MKFTHFNVAVLDPKKRQQRERGLKVNLRSSFQSLSRLFILTYSVKSTGSVKLNSKGPYSTSASRIEIFGVF